VGLLSTLARRLAVAFASLMAVFGIAATFAMQGLSEVHELLHAVKMHETAVRASLELSSAVRDQYAHQAHTIILGDETHLHFYGDARRDVLARLETVRRHVQGPSARQNADDIEHASDELDRIFRERIVPAVLARDRETILAEHARAQELVSLIQARADDLASQAEASIADFESHAALVQHETVRWALITFAVAVALAAVLALYLAQSVARPVARLEAGAARLAAGALGTRIEVEGPRELRSLAEAFNDMSAKLRTDQARLVESEKLAGIGRLAAGVAHEINNPLAVILGHARLLERGASEPQAADLRIIAAEALRGQQIVEGLLDLSRPVRQRTDRVRLRELCGSVVDRLADAGKIGAVRPRIDGDAVVQAHALRVEQVLTNLLANACEATGPDGHVEVVIEQAEDGGVRVTVSDDGPGISAEHATRVFEPFFTTKAKGTGLGLAVAKAIAKAHGGDVTLDRVEPHGARATLVLPRGGEASG
jgi:two-component system NtrC family sensor kinase